MEGGDCRDFRPRTACELEVRLVQTWDKSWIFAKLREGGRWERPEAWRFYRDAAVSGLGSGSLRASQCSPESLPKQNIGLPR